MAKAAKLKCPKCDRTFSMPAHLARHKNAAHASKARKKAAKKKALRKKARRGRTAKRAGRPKGIAARLGLQNLTIEELGQLITAARAEARQKMAALQKALK